MMTPKKHTSFNALARVPLKRPPKAGRYWTGIKHSKLVESFLATVNTKGWKSEFLNVGLSEDKNDMDFVLGVNTSVHCNDGDLCIGVQTSNARRRAFAVYAGMRSRDGTNLVAFKLPLDLKHGKTFDPTRMTNEILMLWYQRAVVIPDVMASLKARKLHPSESNDVLTGFVRDRPRDGMGWYAIGLVDKDYQTAMPFDVAWSSWALLVAFSKECTKLPPLKQMSEGLRFFNRLPTAWASGTEFKEK